MKEDVLEQVVEDYLQMQGYFTVHNVRFRPSSDHEDYVSRDDSVYSDVDIVGYHPKLRGAHKVVVVSCKSWQSGFAADRMLSQLRGTTPNPARERWKNFRELWSPKWAAGFVAEIERRTGTDRFTYFLAVTRSPATPLPGRPTPQSVGISAATRSDSSRWRQCGRAFSAWSRPRPRQAKWGASPSS